MKKILLIEDDVVFSRLLENFLDKNGYASAVCSRAADAYKRMKEESFDLIISDFRLPDDTGLNVLSWIRENLPKTQVILMTRYSDIRTAIHSIKLGALDYIVKPISPDELLITLRETFKKREETAETASETDEIPEHLVGTDDSTKEMYKELQLVAPTNMSVIIEGESGTGKEYAANYIHRLGNRKAGPFIAVDCGALSKELSASELFGHIKGAFTGALQDKQGHFEMADNGTLFLDEIGNLTYEVQVQLLRAIQERKIRKVGGNKDISVNVRIIAATNEDLKIQVENGLFREDLYHRLNEFKIRIPPLRNRREDIERFAYYFLRLSNKELDKNVRRFSSEVMNIFMNYSWPGNLREFRNIVKRAVLLASDDEITSANIPEEILDIKESPVNSLDLKGQKEEQERTKIIQALRQCRYNKSKAAKLLNINRRTLYMKIEKYNIDIGQS